VTGNSQLRHNPNQKSLRTQNTSIPNPNPLLPTSSSHPVNTPATNSNNSTSNQNTHTNTTPNVNGVITHGKQVIVEIQSS
jgi:hypothetical protein